MSTGPVDNDLSEGDTEQHGAAMIGFTIRRLGQGLVVLLLVSIIVFALGHLSGDPAVLRSAPGTPPEQIELVRQKLGLDRPLYEQYFRFLIGALTGDFGTSITYRQDAMAIVLQRVGPTLMLASVALLMSMLIALPLGILAAVKRGTVFDHAARTVALLGQCIPLFYLGIVLLLFFGLHLRWLPIEGSPTLQGIILPAFTLGLGVAAQSMRILRSSMSGVLGEDYMRTAKSKGLPRQRILVHHGLRNAAIPVLTVIGLDISFLIGGSVVVEVVFSYPGMGMLAYHAINNRDFILVQAFVLLIAVVVVAINYIIDIVYGLIDPRIKHK